MGLDKLVFQHKDLKVTLPQALNKIFKEIKESKQMLKVWDDDDLLPVDYQTWKSSVEFLVNYANLIYNKYNIVIETPEINSCTDNSIDLSWKTQNAALTLNISKTDDKTIAFYYDTCYPDYTNKIKQRLPTNEINKHLIIWMKNYLKT